MVLPARLARTALVGCALVAPLVATNAPAQVPLQPRPIPTPTTQTLAPSPVAVAATKAQLLIGTGISDITGPAAEVGMMGYGKSDQITSGIQTRLWARAYVFANQTTGKRVVFVSAELGQLFGSIKQGVLKSLAQTYGSLYDDRNVQIAATHTHAGPGGYSHHLMYNVTSKGFIKQNYDAIVSGITRAIVLAHGKAQPGNVRIAQGPLTDVSVQRAAPALALDSESRSTSRPPDVNQMMTVLRLNRVFGGTTGAITWFSIHNASASRFNTLISSDNKGHASLLFEKARGTVMPFVLPGEFVAAFPNGDEGDVSPNIGPSFTGPGGRTEFESVAWTGEKQYARADSLFNAATEDLGSEVDFRHTFVSMPGLDVTTRTMINGSPALSGDRTTKLCNGAYGMSFAAGAKDGPTGMAPFTEGMKVGQTAVTQIDVLRRWAATVIGGGDLSKLTDTAWNDPCHAPKPILVPSGAMGATPNILPFQILRIGSLAILGVPGEMTSMAGRRLTARVQAILAPKGVTRVILTGLANEYSGYITTPEEYEAQLYEGASTLFGRLTFDAYAQIFDGLARAMAAGTPSPAGPTPPDLGGIQKSFQTPVVLDTVKTGETIGQALIEPPAVVASNGERPVVVRFRAGHPKNNLRTNDTYFFIEKKNGAAWERVVWDAMPEATFTWKRDPDGGPVSSLSYVEVSWMPPIGTAGTYRVRHFGSWMTQTLSNIRPYEGTSREFAVRPEAAQCKTLRAQEADLVRRIASLQQQLGALGTAQQQCQAGTDGTGGARKPAQCVDAEDRALKTSLQTQVQSAVTSLGTVRNTKTSTGCVY